MRSRWVEERRPDLVCITGDLLSRPRGEPLAASLLERLGHPYVVLGNHDLALSRDPFSQTGLARAARARDAAQRRRPSSSSCDGRTVELAGVDPRSWLDKRPSGFDDSAAALRILLCHFPNALDRVPPGRWNLILAGHLHAGQIALPYGFGRLLLAHPSARHSAGVYRRGGTVMHVSPGLGTTFVPFRFAARPEATELVLRCGDA